MVTVPDWLNDDVLELLQKLMVLRLPGTPAADSVQATATVWLEALQAGARDPERRGLPWDAELDRQRVQRAIRQLLASADRWPAPRTLIDGIGSRAPPLFLPPPPLTDAQVARNRQRAQQLLQSLKGKTLP